MQVTVHKCNHNHEIKVSYSAHIVYESSQKIIVDTHFSYPKNYCIGGLTLENGDRCVEAFYFEKWYNIFEVYQLQSDYLKGWYCNITKPFCFQENHIYYYDLALDLVVLNTGDENLLDEDEFEVLNLDEETKNMAWSAVDELKNILKTNEVPLLNQI